jgi:hypothetical protein
MIGIFWVYKNTVFGHAIPAEKGEDRGAGVFDSPDNHSDFWDRETDHVRRFPELRHCEYFDIPRGRALYSEIDRQALVYMDKALFTETTKQRIAEFFQLESKRVAWRTDDHYSTDPDEIDRLFEEP